MCIRDRFSFLQANGIQSMQQLHEKIADMNSRYYDLRGKIVKAERRITTLTERGEMLSLIHIFFLTVTETEQQAKIVVADNGNGIAASDLPHIFERMYLSLIHI